METEEETKSKGLLSLKASDLLPNGLIIVKFEPALEDIPSQFSLESSIVLEIND